MRAEFPECSIKISGEGCNFTINITGEIFAGKNRLQRQQAVNRVLKKYIQDGTIHAVTIIAKTPEELNNG